MNRVDRLMAMVVQLQSRRVVRAEDLAAHFEISVRTVYRDLTALSEAGIPLTAEAGVGYSLVKGYYLPPVMFTADEASALFLGGKLVDHLTDASLSKQMGSALLKIRSVLPRDRQDYLDRLERSTAVLGRGSLVDPRLASEALIPIQRALADRRVLALTYKGKGEATITRREVEPLGLVFYGDQWHLIAFCRLRNDFRDFRTDRILTLESRIDQFLPREDFSLKEYLQSCKESGVEMAHVRFVPDAVERVRREWFCGALEEKQESAGVVVTLVSCSHEWFAEWILSFGIDAEVLAPKELKDRVAGLAQKVAARYGSAGRL